MLLSNLSQAFSFIDKPTVREMREKGSYVLDAEQVEKLSQAQFGLQKVAEHLGNCSAGPSSLRAEIRVVNLLDEEGKSGPFSKWVLHMFVEKPALRAS